MKKSRIGLLGTFVIVCTFANDSIGDGNMTTKNKVEGGDPVRIVVDVPQKPVAGQAMEIKLTLQNDSGKDILCAHGSPYRDFSIVVKDFAGTNVPMTKFGQQVMQGNPRDSYKRNVKPLPSGKSTQVCLNIARLFDLTIAGKYTISVSRTIDENVPSQEREVSTETVLVVQEPE